MIGLISITLLLFVPILSGISLDNIGDLRLILIFGAGLLFIAGGSVSKDTSKRTSSSHNPLSYWVVVMVILLVCIIASTMMSASDVSIMVSPLGLPATQAYFLNLHKASQVKMVKYCLRGKAIIYGVVCILDQMVYIGSTNDPYDRMCRHLITHDHSNSDLQLAIKIHGLRHFKVVVFEFITLPAGLTPAEIKSYLAVIEQRYILLLPRHRLYNKINAKG
jgi:hypothetical protein